jgi:hypothetical protein
VLAEGGARPRELAQELGGAVVDGGGGGRHGVLDTRTRAGPVRPCGPTVRVLEGGEESNDSGLPVRSAQ